jgi:hypothetical protein
MMKAAARESVSPAQRGLPEQLVRLMRRVLRGAGLAVLWAGAWACWLWTLLAICFYGAWPVWLRLGLAVIWGLGIPASALGWQSWVRPRAFARVAVPGQVLIGMGLMLVAWKAQRPSNDREWLEVMDRVPTAEFHGRSVTVHNVRNFAYRSLDDFDARWETRTYDLTAVESADLLISGFSWDRRGPAHSFFSFGFEDGEHLAISVEARREEGEYYSPLRGLFRQYELMYVVGDELDLVARRTNYGGTPLYLYRLRVEPALVQALLTSALQRANRLAGHPEFYNTLTSSCSTNMVRHVEQLYQAPLPFDPRKWVPGYLDNLAYELGFLATDGDPDEMRAEHLINDRNLVLTESRAWSRQIRGLAPLE